MIVPSKHSSPNFAGKGLIRDDASYNAVYQTPKKEVSSPNFYNSEKSRSSPENIFTPLRIPGTTKFDNFETSNFYFYKLTYLYLENQLLKS